MLLSPLQITALAITSVISVTLCPAFNATACMLSLFSFSFNARVYLLHKWSSALYHGFLFFFLYCLYVLPEYAKHVLKENNKHLLWTYNLRLLKLSTLMMQSSTHPIYRILLQLLSIKKFSWINLLRLCDHFDAHKYNL